MRKMAKDIIGANDFVEVFIDTPIEICEERDIKGLYKKARAGEITDFTGVNAPYEIPLHPDIHIQTKDHTAAESLIQLLETVIPYVKLIKGVRD